MAMFREHAARLAAAVVATEAVVGLDPPQTSLFHVHVPLSSDALEQAGAGLIAEEGVQLFLYARPSSTPHWSAFEISVGENALEFSPDEVASLVRDIIERGRRVDGKTRR